MLFLADEALPGTVQYSKEKSYSDVLLVVMERCQDSMSSEKLPPRRASIERCQGHKIKE